MDGFIQRMQALPFRCFDTAVYGFRPVKLCITPRYKVAMPVCNIALVVGIDRVVGSIGQQLHVLFEAGKIGTLGTLPGLYQSIDVAVHGFNADRICYRVCSSPGHGEWHRWLLIGAPPCHHPCKKGYGSMLLHRQQFSIVFIENILLPALRSARHRGRPHQHTRKYASIHNVR